MKRGDGTARLIRHKDVARCVVVKQWEYRDVTFDAAQATHRGRPATANDLRRWHERGVVRWNRNDITLYV